MHQLSQTLWICYVILVMRTNGLREESFVRTEVIVSSLRSDSPGKHTVLMACFIVNDTGASSGTE